MSSAIHDITFLSLIFVVFLFFLLVLLRNLIYNRLSLVLKWKKCADVQTFVSTKTLVTDFCGIKSDKKSTNPLSGNIRKRGVMDKFISDRVQVEFSSDVENVLCSLCIDDLKRESRRQR